MRAFKLVWGLVFLFAVFSGGHALADTNVSGLIGSDTTWTKAGSPYIVVGSVLVNTGVTLTIEPGVSVKFNSLKVLLVDGTLIARGTSEEKVIFTSSAVLPAAGDWGYILFSNSSTDATYDESGSYIDGSILEYAAVEYAGGASVSENGAVRMNQAHPFIHNCTISNNKASGIYAYYLSGTLKIADNIISNNISASSGGGVYVSGGVVVISYNTISNNTAGGGDGGGVATCNGTALISNNNINNNSSDDGGGIYVCSANATVSNNIIQYNSASLGGGGGICVYSGSTATIFNNLISNNTASAANGSGNSGGGIGVYRSIATISKNHITNNITAGDGGGISVYDSGSDATIISDNIISYNQLSSGGFSYGGGGGIIVFDAVANISGNIISENTALSRKYDGQPQVGGGIYTYWGTAIISNNSITKNSALNASAVYYSRADNEDFKYNTITNNMAMDTDPTYVYTVYASSRPVFNYNNLFDNIASNSPFFYEIYNDNPQGSANLNSEYNWWGTSDSSVIDTKIYDWFDDASKGVVDFSPYLTALNTDAPVSPPASLAVIADTDYIDVSWAANPEGDIAGYKVYWGKLSEDTYTGVADAGNTTSYRITGLGPDTYNVAVTAYDTTYNPANDDPATIVNENQTNGNESWYSLAQAVITKTHFEEDDPAIAYTGAWSPYTCASCSGGALKYSGQTGAKATFTFDGTGIRWLAAKAPNLGKAKVYLDGVYQGLVDLYSASVNYKVPLEKRGLAPGTHTVDIEVSGQKNPASTGRAIDIDAFEIIH